MKIYLWACLALIGLAACSPVQTKPAQSDARPPEAGYTIVIGAEASPAELHAADELALHLWKMTGGKFPIMRDSEAIPKSHLLLVGPSRRLAQVMPDLDLTKFGGEEYIIRTQRRDLILAGGRPRGTLYAVYGLLEDHLGCRWFTPDVAQIPHRNSLALPTINQRVKPALEYRESFWTAAFDGDWAVRNRQNSSHARLKEKHGGKITYLGFVHTFLSLVPPDKFYQTHPEYYAEIGGKRVWEGAQLCLTNPEVVDVVVAAARQWMKDHPDANIISISQNDSGGRCECAACKKLEEEEGSPAGPLILFVNKVAERLEREFPKLAFDTLAYRYTRKPPKTVRPRPNVIVRLCSTECSFAQPLSGEKNKAFGDDIRGWAKVCNRLYIWDYVTDFEHYLQPFPNLRVLKPNIEFFVNNGVKGVFEEGCYNTEGGEFCELKAWLLAKLLWDPKQDATALINEFLENYYGAAAPHIRRYIDMLHNQVEALDFNLLIGVGPDAAYLMPDIMARAEHYFDAAEAAVKDKPELLGRVRRARLPVYYVMLARGVPFKPIPGVWTPSLSGQALYDRFAALAKDAKMTLVSEGTQLESFLTNMKPLPRKDPPTPPPGCDKLAKDAWVDMQDYLFRLYRMPELSRLVMDPEASDEVAAWMPGTHQEWAVQCPLNAVADPLVTSGAEWRFLVSVKCRKAGSDGMAFTFGWYDTEAKTTGQNTVQAANLKEGYQVYDLGVMKPNANIYLWVAPALNGQNVPEMWVDRFWAVKVKE